MAKKHPPHAALRPPRIVAVRYEDGRELEVVDDEMLDSIMFDYFHRDWPQGLQTAFPDQTPQEQRLAYKVLTIARQSQESYRKSANAKRPRSKKPLPTKEELLAFRDDFEAQNGIAQGWKRAACGVAKRHYERSDAMNEFCKKYPRLDVKELVEVLGE